MKKIYTLLIGLVFLVSFVNAYPDRFCWILNSGTICLNGTSITGLNLSSALVDYYTITQVDSLITGNISYHETNFKHGNTSTEIFNVVNNGTFSKPGNCSDGYVVQNTTINGVQCIQMSSGSGGNSSFNQSLTDSLYYSILNPLNFINFSNLTAYNTTAQLYTIFLNITDQRYNDSSLFPSSERLWLYNITEEVTGFQNRLTTVIAFNNNTRNFTISPTGSTFDYYVNNTKCTKGVQNITIPSNTGMNYIYYTDCNDIKTSQTPWTIQSVVQVATVYYDNTTGQAILGDERHGLTMDWATHEFIHDTIGTRYESGLTLTAADTTFNLTTGQIDDEDIEFTIPATNRTDVFYRKGANWSWIPNATQYYFKNATDMYYDNNGVLTAVPSNQYIAIWFFADNSRTGVAAIVGQRVDGTLANARANNVYSSLSFGTLPSNEMKILYRVILRNDATPYEETQDLRSVSTLASSNFVATSHSGLSGLLNDDHPQYLRTDGTRALTANWNAGAFNITSTDTINASKLITTGNNICNDTVCFTLQELNASSGGGWVGTAESDLDFQNTYNIINVLAINGIDPSTWITSESDPVYSANTYAVDMNQNVGTDDTPSFTGLTLPGSGGSWSVYVDVDNSLNFLWS